MAVLGEGRVIGHIAVQPEPTKPARGEVKMHLLAQSGCRSSSFNPAQLATVVGVLVVLVPVMLSVVAIARRTRGWNDAQVR